VSSENVREEEARRCGVGGMAASCTDTSQDNLLRWGFPIGCADAVLEELGHDALHEAIFTIFGGGQDG
jgi:hypothetical protein